MIVKYLKNKTTGNFFIISVFFINKGEAVGLVGKSGS